MKYRALSLFLSLVMLTGCAGETPSVPGGTVAAVPAASRVAAAPAADIPTDAYAAYAGFAVELLRQSRSEGEDVLVSPLSVTLALGMTGNGAAGDTAGEFSALFGMDADALNALCAKFLADYQSLGGSTQAVLVNSLWCDPALTLDEEFTARCQQVYGAELFCGDLQDPDTVKALNGWVSDATRGLIPQVADQFSADAVLALVNAIYLKNQFETPFETPYSPWTMDFTAEDGTVGHPKGMRNGQRSERYLCHDGGQGVVLPYDDGRLGLLLMLPDAGTSLTDYLAAWDGDTIRTLLDGAEERRTALTVPKFQAEWGGSLADILTEMGLAGAFDPDRADFAALGRCEDGPLCVGDVLHKTVFTLNEKGTEAAAVTAAIMDACGTLPPDDLVVLRYDRPFVYGIVDLETAAPLFLGTAERLS